MHSTTVLILTLAGSLGSLPAIADEYPINIETDLQGQYFLVEKGGTADRPTLVVRRAGPDYDHYTKRELDCTAATVRYLGEGESLEAVAKSEPDAEPAMDAIEQGSIADQLAKLVCPRTQRSSD